MREVPSLVTLCIGAIRDSILDENGNLDYVYELPSELLDQIIPNLPSLALQNLQDAMPSVKSDDCLQPSRKRKRFEDFEVAWKALYKSRWPVVQEPSVNLLPQDVQQDETTTNWQQIYWEKHLQNCLDAIMETVSFNLIDGCLGDVEIPDALLMDISDKEHVSRSRSYSKLTYHCERFGLYTRSLRLQSVHCDANISNLLRKSRLEYLEIYWIKSKEQVEGLCKLLVQNRDTLESLEFVNCKLPAILVSTICQSLHVKGSKTDVIKKFTMKRSSFLDILFFPLPLGFESLLRSTSGLTSLILSDNHMERKTTKMVFDTLLDAESGLQVLDLSENNVDGWLSHLKWGSPNGIKSDQQITKSLKSLRVLNLRSNFLKKDDIDCLKYAMVYMPNLEVLNLSENPLNDEGVRILVSYLVEKSRSDTPLTELYLELCNLTCSGAKQLLKVLAKFKVPLRSLSIGNNYLSSEFGKSLGSFLCSGIQAIDVKGTRLGVSGFSKAQQKVIGELSLVSINISHNEGEVETAKFLSKVISRAPKLKSINASGNWIHIDSLPDIRSCLEAGKGKLEHLDLRKNPLCNEPDIASVLAEFQIHGKPNILLTPPVSLPLPLPLPVAIIYDIDP